jgi:peptidyl-Lys metalloendopeptidase
MFVSTRLVSLFLYTTLMSTAAIAAHQNIAKQLRCELTGKATVIGNEPITLNLMIKNTGKQTVRLLRRNTPLEIFLADYLDVTYMGNALAYQGPVAKRAIPTAEEYVSLAPGKSAMRSFELSPAYDVSAPGKYVVMWSGDVLDAAAGSSRISPKSPKAIRLICAPVYVERKSA